MPAKLVDGRKLAEQLLSEVAVEVKKLKSRGIEPCLAVAVVGSDAASAVYVGKKEEACERAGIKSLKIELPERVSEEELLAKVSELNSDSRVHGILVQLPLPKRINESRVIQSIAVEKDVDGFSTANFGRLFQGSEAMLPCTAAGVIKLIESTGTKIEGKNAVVVGRGNAAGKPIAAMLSNRNATVTVCHSKTKNLAEHTINADILVVAVGKPKLIDAEMVKQNAVVIDVGINRLENGKIVGDADFETVKGKAAFITPVPGGVGPMTVAMLMHNTVKAASRQQQQLN